MRKQLFVMSVLSVLAVSSAFGGNGDVKAARSAMKDYKLDDACGVKVYVGDSQPGLFADRDLAIKNFGSHGYIWMTDCDSQTQKDPMDKKKKTTNISCRGIYETEQTADGKVCLVDRITIRGLGDNRPAGVVSEVTLTQQRLENVPITQACTLDYIEKHKKDPKNAVAPVKCTGK